MEKIKELEELSKSLIEWLKKNYSPHATIIITDTYVKVVRDEIGIPIKDND